MKILLFVLLACLAVICLASKPSKKPQGHKLVPPHRRHSPNAEEKVGWGWNTSGGPLDYGKPPKCVDKDSIPVTDDWDTDFFSRERLWYYSVGTAYGLNLYYKVLNSLPAIHQSQIYQMCPAIVLSLTSPIINSGSGVQFTQICDGIQNSVCYTSTDNSTYDVGVDPHALERQDIYMVGTDSKNYAIYYVCNDYVHGDLQMLTTRPYVTPGQMRTFLSLFSGLNISTSEAQASICSPFPATGYPNPFEGYPQSGVASNGGWGQGPSAWDSTVSSNGWSVPSKPNNGWSGNNNGWSQMSGWSGNGWGSDSGPSSGWGWDSSSQGWSVKIGSKKEDAKKAESVSQKVVAEVVAELAQ